LDDTGASTGYPAVRYDQSAGVRPPPAVDAASYLLADLTTGEVLAARDPHRRLPPASTLKMLTALTLLDQLDPATVYTAVWEDAAVEGSRVGLVPEATYTVDELFLGLFLGSGNDAALALAHAAGGVQATVAAMNVTATRLGARDTRARTPHGLDSPGQYSSAYDLALIARAGLARPDFRRYAATRQVAFPGQMPARPGDPRPTFMIYNHNRLLGTYDGAFGVKTGYTTQARNTFVGAARRDGRALVVTLMHAGPRPHEQAAALLDWGFVVASRVAPVASLTSAEPVDAAASAHRRSSAVSTAVPTHEPTQEELGLLLGGSGQDATAWGRGSNPGEGSVGTFTLLTVTVASVLALTVIGLRARVLLRRRWRRRRLR
jgi:D-alanyl-D-alanine carboxypeptidase (penicillin-binding protein 5/6)